jgi:hypothetical protein
VLKCPSCKSDRIRRSRHRPEDSVWRSAFYTPYRCRNCSARFHRLNAGLVLGAAVTGGFALIAVFFVVAGGMYALLPATPEQGENPPAAETVIERPLEQAKSPFASDPQLVTDAEGGNAKAQFRLGMAYLKGEGVDRDQPTALKWIGKSAEQGYSEAQYTLGVMHHAGRGALQSFPLAFKWFELAAQQNHAEAQYSLGILYRNGQGVAVDKSKAYVWFNLAASQGHERAREARDSLLPALSAEQVLAAQRMAQEWQPGAPKK